VKFPPRLCSGGSGREVMGSLAASKNLSMQNKLNWVLRMATDISDFGQIVGTSKDGGGFPLTPVCRLIELWFRCEFGTMSLIGAVFVFSAYETKKTHLVASVLGKGHSSSVRRAAGSREVTANLRWMARIKTGTHRDSEPENQSPAKFKNWVRSGVN
jgi:hypothetical protein